MSELISNLAAFLRESPGCYHAVDALRRRLDARGFTALREGERWTLSPGRDYYVIRNGSSILSFRLPAGKPEAFHIIASHSDSPGFKLKPNPVLWSDGMLRLNVEGYGGMLRRSWFDRPLSIAGRVLTEEDGALRQRLVYFDRDLLMIPSAAIHLVRESQQEGQPGIQSELLPILGATDALAWDRMLLEAAGVEPERILGSDLFLTCRMEPAVWGADGEFFSAPRLDDLACCYAALEGFLAAAPLRHVSVHCVFDNEEVGSRSMQGAESTFLSGTLRRVAFALGMDEEALSAAVARSFLVSADNAHAFHPNYAGKYDVVNRPRLGGGIVLKHQAGQRYTTDAVSEAVFRLVCRGADVPCQEYANHSDVPGGSTLGNISNTQLSVRSVDIGLPQLAMHSAYETIGTADPEYLSRFSGRFFREPLPEIK